MSDVPLIYVMCLSGRELVQLLEKISHKPHEMFTGLFNSKNFNAVPEIVPVLTSSSTELKLPLLTLNK